MSQPRIASAVLTLLGPGVVIESMQFDPDRRELVVCVRPDRRRRPRCGRCGTSAAAEDHGEGLRRWRHLDACGAVVWIQAEAPRVRCPEHGRTVIQVPWARHNAGHTRAFDDKVAWMATHMSKTAVCALMRIGWDSVGRIVDRWVADADAARPDPLDGLTRIGIDEISYKKHHKYLIVVVCHNRRRLVWAAPGRDKQTLHGFFDQLGPDRYAAISHVSADCAQFIVSVVAQRCPNAVLAADPFHVVAWTTEALDQVRRRIWNTVRTPTGGRRHTNGTGKGKRIKDARWALWKNPEDLSANQTATLAWIEIAHPALHRAYEYKERLRLLLKLPAADAEPALRAWIKAAKLSRIPEIRDLAFKIARHKTAILAAIEHDLSNGLIESTNTKIRLYTRLAYGFKKPEHLIALIKLALGGYHPNLPWQPPTQLSVTTEDPRMC